jgi:PAS domain S-box-containing protein
MPSVDEINALWLLAASVIGACAWFWRTALRSAVRVVVDYIATPIALMKAFGEVSESISEMRQELADVRHEVMPNGGGSLRDSVDRTERQIGTLTHGLNYLLGEARAVSITMDATGQVTEVSPRAMERLGCRLSDLTGDGWLTYVDTAEVASVADELRIAIAQQRGMQRRVTFVSRDGLRIPCAFEMRAVRDPAGKVTGYIGFVRGADE